MKTVIHIFAPDFDATDIKEHHLAKSNKPRKSEHQEAPGQYGNDLHEKHHFNNFYDNDQTYENLNG